MRSALSKKVIVAMSGGVDSSVVAALLKNDGYDVTGVFMNFWKDSGTDEKYENKCCSLESIESARAVAHILDIPFYVLNVQREFKKKVVDSFLSEMKKGNTPNPCVVCNKEIKFAVLLQKMFSLEADCVATGHYARIIKHKTANMKQEFSLAEAKDKEKDQSYFLYRLSQKDLSKIVFPLGNYTKPEVRKLAKKFKLPVHDKKESQDICFIPEKGYENFLAKKLKPKKGLIKDKNGAILGKHAGLPFYTIGQRKGIKVGGKGPYYVVRKDVSKNVLCVGNIEELVQEKMTLTAVHWTKKEPAYPWKTLLRTRYRNPLVYATIQKYGNRYEAAFDEPQRAISPGQSAVFYSKNGAVLGGGIIT